MDIIKDIKLKFLRSDIQQIRAISVIAVVLFHSFPNKFIYGYLGVDVFFFLSGFLIFPQIYDITKSSSKKTLTFNTKKFILRRIYRIAPALGVCILIVWVLFFFFGPSPKKLSGQEFYISIFSLFGIGNIAALRYSGDYFNSISPFTHFWSLGVEIQSYLVFAVLALFFAKIIDKDTKKFRIFLLTIILFSLVSKYFFLYHSNFFKYLGLDTLAITGSFSNFYLTPNRMWQFALGGLIATFSAKKDKYRKLNKQASKPLLITISILFFSTLNFTNNLRTILILVCVGLYLISDVQKEIKYASKILVWIGDRSYSIYLYHLPLLYILRSNSIPESLKAIIFPAVIFFLLLLANLSYKYIELAHGVPKFNSGESLKFYIVHKKLIFTSYIVPTLTILTVVCANNIFPKHDKFPVTFRDNYAASELSKCPLGQIHTPCTLIFGASNRNWLLLGDSHAGAIQGVLAEIANQSQSTLTVWNKCRFFDPKLSLELSSIFPKWCIDSNTERLDYIKTNKPNLIFIAYQNGFLSYGDKKLSQKLWQDIFTNTLVSINENYSKVILFSQIPEYENSPIGEYRYMLPFDKNLAIQKFSNLKPQRKFEKYLLTKKILILDLVPTFCSTKSCTRFTQNLLYLDTNHLSNFGADFIKPTIEKYLIVKNLH